MIDQETEAAAEVLYRQAMALGKPMILSDGSQVFPDQVTCLSAFMLALRAAEMMGFHPTASLYYLAAAVLARVAGQPQTAQQM